MACDAVNLRRFFDSNHLLWSNNEDALVKRHSYANIFSACPRMRASVRSEASLPPWLIPDLFEPVLAHWRHASLNLIITMCFYDKTLHNPLFFSLLWCYRTREIQVCMKHTPYSNRVVVIDVL